MTRTIPLTQGHMALVDDADYEWVAAVGAWQLNRCAGNLYAGHATNRANVRMHNLILDSLGVDHINGDGLDNRRANLRVASASQNGANIAAPSHNTSGFKGATLYKRTGRWRAYITVNRERRYLGYFDTSEQAARAYDRAAFEAWGEFARLNFPTTNEEIPA